MSQQHILQKWFMIRTRIKLRAYWKLKLYAEVSCEIRVKMRTDHMRHWYWTSSSSQAWTMSDLTDEWCGLDSRKGKLSRWSSVGYNFKNDWPGKGIILRTIQTMQIYSLWLWWIQLSQNYLKRFGSLNDMHGVELRSWETMHGNTDLSWGVCKYHWVIVDTLRNQWVLRNYWSLCSCGSHDTFGWDSHFADERALQCVATYKFIYLENFWTVYFGTKDLCFIIGILRKGVTKLVTGVT